MKKVMTDDKIRASTLMPGSIEDLQLLEERARKLALVPVDDRHEEAEISYLQFQLNANSHYGILQKDLDEVIETDKITRIKWLPAFIAGVISWKGIILTVLDTNFLATGTAITQQLESYTIIIVADKDKKVGLLVNEIDGFIDYKPSELKTGLQSPIKFNPNYFLGLLNESVVLLNLDILLSDSALEIT